MHTVLLCVSEISRLQRGGAEPAPANPHAKQTEKVYIPYDSQKTVLKINVT